MSNKIKPKDFQKRREQSKTYRDWNKESNVFRSSIAPSFGVITSDDKLYDKKHKRKTILDEEFTECENTNEVINAILKRVV